MRGLTFSVRSWSSYTNALRRLILRRILGAGNRRNPKIIHVGEASPGCVRNGTGIERDTQRGSPQIAAYNTVAILCNGIHGECVNGKALLGLCLGTMA